MKNYFFLVLLLLLIISCKKNKAQHDDTLANIPFPNHTSYTTEHIKPTNYSQTELDNHVKNFYDNWKNQYLENKCNSNEYYIASGDGKKTISEAHGYGMLIMCFMAGYEQSAKTYFDGMFRYFKSHPSRINNQLMDWEQKSCKDKPSDGDNAASDGDIDIAFSLLLADKQWGSNGEINYLSEAKTMINAIMQDEINKETWTVSLGDWPTLSNPSYYYGTRSSDFITSHFKSFSNATGISDWETVSNKCYDLIEQTSHSETGLVPDFIVHTNTLPDAAEANYLESPYDGNYYYNACRFPWRIGVDYLLNGDSKAKTTLNKINDWIIFSSGGDVSLISNGYLLNGTALYDWNDPTFIGPFTVCAMASTTSQTWLNHIYSNLIIEHNFGDGDYYSNTIKLLSLITISGNYWQP